jgi:hypothetical protein
MTDWIDDVLDNLHDLMLELSGNRPDEVASMTNEEVVEVLQGEGIELPFSELMKYATSIRGRCHDFCFTDPDELY